MDFERDQKSTRRMADAAIARGRQDAEKAVSRLLFVNRTLEQKHKQQVEESRQIKQRCTDLEQRAQHYEQVAEEKTKINKQLQDEIFKGTQRQEDNLIREREYGKRIVNLHIDHMNRLNIDQQRIKKMHTMLADGPTADQVAQHLGDGSSISSGSHDIGNSIREALENDLGAMFEARVKSIEKNISRHESKLERSHRSMHQDHVEVLKGLNRAIERPGTQAAAVQTELTLLKSDEGGRFTPRKMTQFKLPTPVRATKTSHGDSIELKNPPDTGNEETAAKTTGTPIARGSISVEVAPKRPKPSLRRMHFGGVGRFLTRELCSEKLAHARN